MASPGLRVALLLLVLATCSAEVGPYADARIGLTVSCAEDSGGGDDVVVKRAGDALELTCAVRGHAPRAPYLVWSLLTNSPYRAYSTRRLEDGSSRLELAALTLNDTGHYVCAAPPLSSSKYILVQAKPKMAVPRGAFSCAPPSPLHVLPRYVCDGRADCPGGEDEARDACGSLEPCQGKLNCSDGRCISEALCCDRLADGDCVRPSCCDQYLPAGYGDLPDLVMQPAVLDGEQALGEDYGFIQTTIYTVTACALIFMIAVVLLVSAICKMHMKRSALRSYARAERHHYSMHAAQARFPPCYEASRLLEPEFRPAPVSGSRPASAGSSPRRQPTAPPTAESPQAAEPTREPPEDEAADPPVRPTDFGFGRLANAIFNSRYRQVPTQCCDVEMTSVAAHSPPASPARRARLDDYRSPAYCDLNGGDFYFTNAETGCYGRELNYSAPLDFYMTERVRRATAVERLLDRISFNTSYRVDAMEQSYGRSVDRSLTLQLGRFQLSLPRFTRARRDSATDRRPDTPNVAELNIDELDFVRLNSNETYTLNGRTIRLLGANFENYPSILSVGNPASFVGRVVAPPPYSEVVHIAPSKVFGPPPAYLSRENLTTGTSDDTNRNSETASESNRMSTASEVSVEVAASGDCNGNVEPADGHTNEARSTGNVELPPRYEEATGNLDNCDTLDANANADVVANTNLNVHSDANANATAVQ